MSFSEWDPGRNRPATEIRPHGCTVRDGCEHQAVVRLGAKGDWHLCATCAELPRFRRYRVASRLSDGRVLRRNVAGWWWRDDQLRRPRPLAEVLR